MDTNKLISALTNTKSVIAICSLSIIILQNMGIHVDNVAVTNIVQAICGIGVLVGVMNNDGLSEITWNK